eukprot:gene40658-32973_t
MPCFDAFVAHVVPSIVFAWIFLKECPTSHQEALIEGKNYEQLKSDWAAQDKPENLTMIVRQQLVHDPQKFLPNSDCPGEYTIVRHNREERIGINAVGSEFGCIVVVGQMNWPHHCDRIVNGRVIAPVHLPDAEIVDGSAAAAAEATGGSEGMRLLEIEGLRIRHTQAARRKALRADKEAITRRWRDYSQRQLGQLCRQRLCEAYGGGATKPTRVRAGPFCRGWINITHGPVIRRHGRTGGHAGLRLQRTDLCGHVQRLNAWMHGTDVFIHADSHDMSHWILVALLSDGLYGGVGGVRGQGWLILPGSDAPVE